MNQSALYTNETIELQDNPESAWDTNQTIALKKILKMPRILIITKQSNLKESSEFTRYKQSNRTKEIP